MPGRGVRWLLDKPDDDQFSHYSGLANFNHATTLTISIMFGNPRSVGGCLMRVLIGSLIVALAYAGLAQAQSAETYVYDIHGRLTGKAQVKPTGSNFSGYAYDAADSRTLRRSETHPLPAASETLASGEEMVLQQSLTSADHRFTLTFQRDGNIAIWMGPSRLWATNTEGTQAIQFAMQLDGNLVLYGPNYAVLWASGTGSPGSRLVMQDDGNLVIYSGWTPVWSTGTGGH